MARHDVLDTVRRLLAAFDRHMEARLRARRQMKVSIFYFLAGVTVWFADLYLAQSVVPVTPLGRDILTLWGPIVAVVTVLLVGQGVRTSVAFIKAELATKASVSEMHGLATLLQSQHADLGRQIGTLGDALAQRMTDLSARVDRIDSHRHAS